MPMSQVAVLRAACCVAGLDQEVCERERPMLERLARAAGVGVASLNAMIDRARTEPNYYREHFEILVADPDHAMKVLLSVAIADGELSFNERVVLHHFADKLGLSEARFTQLLEAAERRLPGKDA